MGDWRISLRTAREWVHDGVLSEPCQQVSLTWARLSLSRQPHPLTAGPTLCKSAWAFYTRAWAQRAGCVRAVCCGKTALCYASWTSSR